MTAQQAVIYIYAFTTVIAIVDENEIEPVKFFNDWNGFRPLLN